MISKKKRGKYSSHHLVLGIFSIVLALGALNPLNPSPVVEGEEVSNTFSQAITIGFVFYLMIASFSNVFKVIFTKKDIFLLLFWGVYILMAFAGATSDYGETNVIGPILKFSLDVVLVILLTNFYRYHPQYINFSLLMYSLCCVILASLFILGLLDSIVLLKSGRMLFWGENPNSTSGRMVVAIVFIIHLLQSNPYSWKKLRYLLLLTIIPLIAVVLTSGSRGSLIILVICIIAYFLFSNYQGMSKIAIAGLVILIVFGFYEFYFSNLLSDFAIIDRINSITEGEDAGRSILSKQALAIFVDRPITGYGASGFSREMLSRFGETLTVHNLYYYILATTGILGGIPFFLYLYSLLKSSLMIRRQQVLPVVLMIFILLLVSKTGGALTYLLIWFLFAIVSAYNSLFFSKRKGTKYKT